jgi:NAD(P)H-nitrite reductase large subunit
MKPEDTVCYCFHVTQRKIVNFIRVHRPRRASQISECGGAGTGCGWCIHYLTRLFEASQTTGTGAEDDLSAADYARGRAAYIRAGKGKPAPGAIPLPPEEETA